MTTPTPPQRLEYAFRLLSQCSPANRPTLERFLRWKRASGLKNSSLMNIMISLSFADNAAAGQRFEDLTPEALTSILEQRTATCSPSTADLLATNLRALYTWLHGGELPGEIRLALKRIHRAEFRDVKPITEDELSALLQIAADTPSRSLAAKRQALIWVLWDSGFRISEALSLQVRDVEFDDRQGARLRLRREAPNLKTGPRTVYVVDCVGALRVWLALHPAGSDPEAAVFPGRHRTHTPMWPANVATLLKQLCQKAGLRHMHPHLFRHTRATRAAAVPWPEADMRKYFGWSATSHMPSHYIHLTERTMEARVRAEAGIDGAGARLASSGAADPVDALLDALAKRLGERGRRPSDDTAVVRRHVLDLADAGELPPPADVLSWASRRLQKPKARLKGMVYREHWRARRVARRIK